MPRLKDGTRLPYGGSTRADLGNQSSFNQAARQNANKQAANQASRQAERQAARQAARANQIALASGLAGGDRGRTGPGALQNQNDQSSGFSGPSGASLAASSVSRPQPAVRRSVQQSIQQASPTLTPPGVAAAPTPPSPESSPRPPVVSPRVPVLSASPAAQAIFNQQPKTEPVRPAVLEDVASQTPRLEPRGFPLLGGGQIAEQAAETAPAANISSGSPAAFSQAPRSVAPFAGTGRTKGLNVSSVPGLTGGGLGLPGSGGGGESPSALLKILQTLMEGQRRG